MDLEEVARKIVPRNFFLVAIFSSEYYPRLFIILEYFY
jgi:hypothetical protein